MCERVCLRGHLREAHRGPAGARDRGVVSVRRQLVILGLVAASLLVVACSGEVASPDLDDAPPATPVATSAPAEATVSSVPSSTPSTAPATSTPAETAMPTATSTSTPLATPAVTATAPPASTPSPAPTAAPTVAPTAVPTAAPAPPAVASPPPTGGVTARIQGFGYPYELTVPAGTSVTWVNDDAVPHDVVAFDGSWASVLLDQGEAYTRPFGTPGRFAYRCSLHPYMQAAVIVE